VSSERKYIFHTNLLQLPVGRRRESPSCQLLGLQAHKGGDAEEEFTENTQDYNGKGILFKLYHSRCVLHGGAPKQHRATAVASDQWQVQPQWN
jgi:hypothetical protein